MDGCDSKVDSAQRLEKLNLHLSLDHSLMAELAKYTVHDKSEMGHLLKSIQDAILITKGSAEPAPAEIGGDCKGDTKRTSNVVRHQHNPTNKEPVCTSLFLFLSQLCLSL